MRELVMLGLVFVAVSACVGILDVLLKPRRNRYLVQVAEAQWDYRGWRISGPFPFFFEHEDHEDGDGLSGASMSLPGAMEMIDRHET